MCWRRDPSLLPRVNAMRDGIAKPAWVAFFVEACERIAPPQQPFTSFVSALVATVTDSRVAGS